MQHEHRKVASDFNIAWQGTTGRMPFDIPTERQRRTQRSCGSQQLRLIRLPRGLDGIIKQTGVTCMLQQPSPRPGLPVFLPECLVVTLHGFDSYLWCPLAVLNIEHHKVDVLPVLPLEGVLIRDQFAAHCTPKQYWQARRHGTRIHRTYMDGQGSPVTVVCMSADNVLPVQGLVTIRTR